jgi:2,3-dihydroxy-2,3-dihydrophenylpropionate dehydrogenase/cis-2,3-dihydrobiphenyl-2,3-diol dehydrogenase
MGWLDGQSVLITGGASGLGLALVERFVSEGALVTVLDRNGTALETLSSLLGDQAQGVVGDVRSLADNRAAVSAAVELYGKLDCFIGNAGIWDYSVPLVDLPDDKVDQAFDEVFAVNTKGYLLGAMAAAPALVRAQGSIVFTLSNAAFYPGGGGPLYTASKHAGVGLVKQLAFELAPHVRVNAVAPGAISSDLRGPAALGQANRSISEVPLHLYMKDGLPLGRLPEASEYAGSYVYLASRQNAGPATGAIINVDGGVGVRGLASVAGGADLLERFGSKT